MVDLGVADALHGGVCRLSARHEDERDGNTTECCELPRPTHERKPRQSSAIRAFGRKVAAMVGRWFVGAASGLTGALLLGAPSTASGAQSAAHTCAVTVVSRGTRPPAQVPRTFDYGNASIAVALNPPNGHLVAGRLPGGGTRATINPNGSIDAKYGWWRSGDDARLEIGGHRLDGPAPRLVADVPNGYGTGFQATSLRFPTTGCWRVTGTFKRAKLSFTVRVTRARAVTGSRVSRGG